LYLPFDLIVNRTPLDRSLHDQVLAEFDFLYILSL
jgi:hypothetical protein